jgi:hypothetical protein
MLTAKFENGVVEFSGILNEQQDLAGLKTKLTQLSNDSNNGRFFADFSKVTRANSAGILVWLKATKELGLKIVYVKTPIWLVEQFNFIDEFFEGDIKVKSIMARFYDATQDDSIMYCLEIGKDIPFKTEYSDHQFNYTDNTGQPLEPDFDPQLFLNFLANFGPKIAYTDS